MNLSQKSISIKVANISLISALLVACIHYQDYVLDGGAAGLAFWEYFPGPILRIAVPFFFTVAGYWLAGHMDEKNWWIKAVESRVMSLLVPFTILNLVWFLVMGGGNVGGLVQALGFKRGEYPALPQTWFVLRLFLLVMISPIIAWIIKQGKTVALLAFFVVYGCIVGRAMYCSDTINCFWMLKAFKYVIPPVGLAGVTIGMAFRRYGIPTVEWWIGAIICGIGFLILFSFKLTWTFYLGMPIFIYGLWNWMTEKEFPKWLARNTFAIYIFHYSFLVLFNLVYQKMGVSNLTRFSSVTILTVIASVILSALIGLAIRRVRILRQLILGGR